MNFELTWTIVQIIYWTGFAGVTMTHMAGGHFTAMSTLKIRGRPHRLPAIVFVIPLIILWPILLPVQLYQYARDAGDR